MECFSYVVFAWGTPCFSWIFGGYLMKSYAIYFGLFFCLVRTAISCNRLLSRVHRLAILSILLIAYILWDTALFSGYETSGDSHRKDPRNFWREPLRGAKILFCGVYRTFVPLRGAKILFCRGGYGTFGPLRGTKFLFFPLMWLCNLLPIKGINSKTRHYHPWCLFFV